MEVPKHWRLKTEREGFRGGKCQHCARLTLDDRPNHGGFCQCGVANIFDKKGNWVMSMFNRDYYEEIERRKGKTPDNLKEVNTRLIMSEISGD